MGNPTGQWLVAFTGFSTGSCKGRSPFWSDQPLWDLGVDISGSHPFRLGSVLQLGVWDGAPLGIFGFGPICPHSLLVHFLMSIPFFLLVCPSFLACISFLFYFIFFSFSFTIIRHYFLCPIMHALFARSLGSFGLRSFYLLILSFSHTRYGSRVRQETCFWPRKMTELRFVYMFHIW